MPDPITSFTGQYRFLSNFYLLDVRMSLDDLFCPTIEHAYQAAKTDNRLHRRRIILAVSPGLAKYYGGKCPIRPNWNEIRLNVMETLVDEKFRTNPRLAGLLEATGDAELIEGNSWGDIFWGVCRGRGENHLGKIIMRVRGELRAELPPC